MVEGNYALLELECKKTYSFNINIVVKVHRVPFDLRIPNAAANTVELA